jgi:cellulose synthase/poly-beta-1,6-N-acetylglucosamine synthase-like glycosyltransferase
MQTFFWIMVAVIVYTYLGYGLLLLCLRWLYQLFSRKTNNNGPAADWPELTIVIAAYNEATVIQQKLDNCFALRYPAGKKHIICVTDGSTDGTDRLVALYPEVQLLHQPERRGKAAAINRAMLQVQTGLVVFTDANTLLNETALEALAAGFRDERIGAVAGEKQVLPLRSAPAASVESIYWQYESLLKKEDARLHSVMGAAGELYAIRTRLFTALPEDTICDDLRITMHIVRLGYRIGYTPLAISREYASGTVVGEYQRKLRIGVGNIQSLAWLPFMGSLIFTWQLLSRKLLRWLVVPYLLMPAWLLNGWLLSQPGSSNGCLLGIFLLQTGWYLWALLGWCCRGIRSLPGIFFLPFYFCLANLAMIHALLRYWGKSQSVNWTKIPREGLVE